MKWFGVLLILSSACLAGLYQVEKFTRRVQGLKQIQVVFTSLRAGIAYRWEPLADLLLFSPSNTFSKCWIQQLQKKQGVGTACLTAAQQLVLHTDDVRLLERFATDAGKLGHQEQLDAIDLLLRQLDENLKAARQEAQNRGRVQLAMAICMGGVVSLLLI